MGKVTCAVGVGGGVLAIGWVAFGLFVFVFLSWDAEGPDVVRLLLLVFERRLISAYLISVLLSGIIGIVGGVVSLGGPITRASAGFFAMAGVFGVVAVLLVAVFVGVDDTDPSLAERLGMLLVAIPPFLSSTFFYIGMRRVLRSAHSVLGPSNVVIKG